MKTTKTFKIQGMHCVSCAMLIEGELEDRGVTANCNFAKQEVVVEFDPQTLSEEIIHQAVQQAGYTIVE